MRLAASLVALGLLLSGCAGDGSPEPRPVVGTDRPAVDTAPPLGAWRLAGFADGDAAVAVEVTFAVDADGRITGNGGCNGYFGQWKLDPAKPTLGPFGATRRMCEPEVMQVEDRFLSLLERVGGWRPTDAGLVLVAPDGRPLLSFRPAP